MEAHSVSLVVIVVGLSLLMTSSEGVDYYGSSPLTAYDVSGHVDRSATLRCQLQTEKHNRGWYVITWHRVEPDGRAIPLIHLPVQYKIPELSTKIPSELQARIQPIITVQPGHVEFNIKISNLTCSDEGEYRCSAVTTQGEIMSAAELGIYASPRTPVITYEYLTPDRPREVTVECKADVGLPPKMLVWYQRHPGATYFSIVDRQRDVIQETDGCHIVSTRTVDITVTTETKGTHYRCGYPGYIEKEGMFDELVLDVEDPGVGEVKEEPKVGSVCAEGHCQDNNDNEADDPKNKATRGQETYTSQLVIISFISFIYILTLVSHV